MHPLQRFKQQLLLSPFLSPASFERRITARFRRTVLCETCRRISSFLQRFSANKAPVKKNARRTFTAEWSARVGASEIRESSKQVGHNVKIGRNPRLTRRAFFDGLLEGGWQWWQRRKELYRYVHKGPRAIKYKVLWRSVCGETSRGGL